MTTKEQILKAMETLPDDATYADAIEQVYLLRRVQRGLPSGEATTSLSQQEILRRVERWALGIADLDGVPVGPRNESELA